MRWQKLAAKHNLKPIFGVELGVTKSSTIRERKNAVDYWTFLCIDDISNLNKLVQLATEQFYYEPVISYEQAMAAEGLIKITGHRADFTQFKPDKNLYVSLSPSTVKGYLNDALNLGHELIACSDNKYTYPADRSLYETIVGRDVELQTYDQFIQTKEQWMKSVSHKLDISECRLAELNAVEVLGLCNAKLNQSELLVPERPCSLRTMCEEGAKKLGCDLTDPVYRDRLERELKLIVEKNFEDYFFIIADICKWARQRMMVGPARGSSCGSLVCYLLEITTIDPIPYRLIFERFIDVNRNDLPDIDIDFSDQHREEVFEYVAERYGKDRVARIGSVSLYKAPSALNEAGAALRIPKWKCDAVAESLLKRVQGDARTVDLLKDTIEVVPAGKELIQEHPEMMIATRMEGHPRHSSQHAAGLVLTKEPAINYLAIDARTNTLQCDKKDAEELSLLKIDALGLTQLSTFEYALELAGLDRLTLEKIPLDDQKAFDVLNKQKFCGVFQFNGTAVQSLVKEFKVTELNDLVAVASLARPGPLSSGNAEEWVRRRNGSHKVAYPHPMFEPYLKNTLGVVAYQEQVMEIGRHIGDLSWDDVTSLRKAMSKSMGAETFSKFGDKWKPAAVAKGLTEEQAEKIWNQLCQFGAYGFCLAHAVAYGVISYQCLWLKAHYPMEFAAATLTNENDEDKQILLLREMVEEGIDYVAVDPNLSTDKWTVAKIGGKAVLVGPLSNIKGIGPKTVEKVISARKLGRPAPPDVVKKIAESPNKLKSLFPIADAFKSKREELVKCRALPPTKIKDVQSRDKEYTVTVWCVLSKITTRDENDAVNVAKRGGKLVTGQPTTSLTLKLKDDSGTISGRITRWDYERIGKPISDRGRLGKCLYVLTGKVRGGEQSVFRSIKIESASYVGDLPTEVKKKKEKAKPKVEQVRIF